MTKAPLLALFSDFGVDGPYCGQVLAKWAELVPDIPGVNLFASSPSFDIEAGAHLLYAYTRYLPKGTVVEAVIDPGVGGKREVCVVQADDYWFCGPSNGLFDVVINRSQACKTWLVDWEPDVLSATFHGRDLFAPIAAHLSATGELLFPAHQVMPSEMLRSSVVSDPARRIIFVDTYGNMITGISGDQMQQSDLLKIQNNTIGYAPRFDVVPKGQIFWYVNSNGLVEVAANQANASLMLSCGLGDIITCSSRE